MVDLSAPIRQQAFGELVGISQQAVSDLVSRGVLKDGDGAGIWLKAYCSHLREAAAGRADAALATERAALAREQKDRIAMQNAVTRKEYAPVIMIEEVLGKTASRIAGIFDAVPGVLRRRFPELTTEQLSAVTAEITRARNTVAAMSLADIGFNTTGEVSDAPEVES